LTSVPDKGEWSASRDGPFIAKDRVARTHWIGDVASSNVGLDTANTRLLRVIARNLTLAVQPAANRYTDPVIPAYMAFLRSTDFERGDGNIKNFDKNVITYFPNLV
jgi:hypothetical protein